MLHAVMKHILETEDDLRKQTEFQEVVFDDYFTKGIYPDKKTLLEAAEQVGAKKTVKILFMDDANLLKLLEEVAQEAAQASRRGISGVPFFEFNSEPAFSGAQSVETFVQYLEDYAE